MATKRPATLRDLIIARVAALDWSISELARRCNDCVSRSSLSQYLNGHHDLAGEKIYAILTALGLRIVVA